MQSLKALQLVEGVPGPKGGYKPTAAAYEALELDQMDETASVPLVLNGERIDDINVDGIDLTTVHHPDLCRAEIHVLGSLTDFDDGDEVSVGPTPLSSLIVDGIVDAKDETNNVVILQIEDMRAPDSDPDR
jgi:predicted transcriptional regulator